MRYDCLKFGWWFFFSSIRSCLSVVAWNNCGFMIYVECTTRWYAHLLFLDMLRFSGKIMDEDHEDLHRVHRYLHISCGFRYDLHTFPANLLACSWAYLRISSSRALHVMLGFNETVRSTLARLVIQKASHFDSSVQQYFKCFHILFVFPPCYSYHASYFF